MNAPLYDGLDMGDEIGFSIVAVPRILHENPELASKCNAADFNFIRGVASCVFFVREFDIKGRTLDDLLPIAEQWIREQRVGYFVRPEQLITAAIRRGYKLVDDKFIYSRNRG